MNWIRNRSKYVLNINKLIYFILLCIIGIGVNEYIKYFHISNQIYFNTYSANISMSRIEEIINKQKKMEWIAYILVPIFLLVKLFYFSCSLTIATGFSLNKINFDENFNIILKSEIIFAIMLLARIISLETFKSINNLADLNYVPFSVLDLLDSTKIPTYLIYPIQLLNLWELLFGIFSINLIKYNYSINYFNSLKIFIVGYIPSLLLWALVVLFINIQFS